MCRKYRAMGWCLLSGGVGMLLGFLLGCTVLGVLLAIALIAAGFWFSGSK